MGEWIFQDKKIQLIEGNLVRLDVDAIVNAANKSLVLGGGVAGAIRTEGGPSIQEECNRLGPIDVGQAVITGAGDLKARYVIHAAGPVYGEGDEDLKLRKATLNSLKIASSKEMDSIAFPAISTGIYRFPLKRCSEIMLKAAIDHLKSHDFPKTVIFCLFGETAYATFDSTLTGLLG